MIATAYEEKGLLGALENFTVVGGDEANATEASRYGSTEFEIVDSHTAIKIC